MPKTATLTVQRWDNSLAVRIPAKRHDLDRLQSAGPTGIEGHASAASETLNQIIDIGRGVRRSI